MSDIAAIILGAGQGTRFRADPTDTKVLALLAGKPLIRHVAEAALASKASQSLVVVGHASERIELALSGLRLRFLHNDNPEAGLSSSLKLGLAAVQESTEGAVILLADMPYVTSALIDRLIDAFEAAPAETMAVVPVLNGRRGNPVLLSRRMFAAVQDIEGDHGARSLIDALDEGVVAVPIDDAAVAFDIDTRDMLEIANLLRPKA
jgi:molybdenum cofactor cytidylyltransferase